MTEVNLWALGGIGLVAGLLGSMLGVGGGIIIVPVLTLALRLPIHVAIGSSLVAIVATSCTATSIYSKNRLTNIRLGLLLETTTTPGAIIGGLVAAAIAPSVLGILFGLILIYTAYTMVTNPSIVDAFSSSKANPAEHGKTANSTNWLTNSYYDQSLNEIVSYRPSHIPHGLTASFFSGALSSLLGIGGGIVNVPVMHIVMGVPMKATIATSSFIIAITATVGTLIYYYYGHIYPFIVAPLIIGVVLGARLGVELTQRAGGVLLRRIFGVFLFIVALLMFLRTANLI